MDFNFDLASLTESAILYLPKVIGAILVVIIGFWIAGKISKMVGKALKKRGTDETVLPFIQSLIGVGIKVIVLVSAAGMFGVETGVVESIQIFNTILSTLDNHRLIVPNGTVTSNVIQNISGQGTVGVPLAYGIGYGDDIDAARAAIIKVANSCPTVINKSELGVSVSEHGDSAVMLATRPFCKSEDYWDTFFFMQENVKKELDAQGISIPFPQRDIHMHSAN